MKPTRIRPLVQELAPLAGHRASVRMGLAQLLFEGSEPVVAALSPLMWSAKAAEAAIRRVAGVEVRG